jgi:ATP-dependent helicase Lhr and Lhr-like helicase
LRSLRDNPEVPEVVYLAATDPANPYGALLKWPAPDEPDEAGVRPSGENTHATPLLSRSVGAGVLLVNGALAAYLRRRNPELLVFLPREEPNRGLVARAVAGRLAELIAQGQSGRGSLIAQINGRPAEQHALAHFLEQAGFIHTPMGFHLRRRMKELAPSTAANIMTPPARHA